MAVFVGKGVAVFSKFKVPFFAAPISFVVLWLAPIVAVSECISSFRVSRPKV